MIPTIEPMKQKTYQETDCLLLTNLEKVCVDGIYSHPVFQSNSQINLKFDQLVCGFFVSTVSKLIIHYIQIGQIELVIPQINYFI